MAPRRTVILRPHSPPSPRDLAELWRHRDLLAMLVRRDLGLRYKQAALGVGWAVLQPALQTALFTAAFHQIGGLRSEQGVPYVPFVLSGLTLWNVFAGTLLHATDSLVRNADLVTRVYFPRSILVLASLAVPLTDFALALTLLAATMLFYGLPVGGLALMVPLSLFSAAAALGPGLGLAALNAAYRDVRHALPFLQQLLIYAAPVFFPLSAVPAGLRPLLALNPVVPLIEAGRAAAFGGAWPWRGLGVAGLEALVLLLAGALYFRRTEPTLADRL